MSQAAHNDEELEAHAPALIFEAEKGESLVNRNLPLGLCYPIAAILFTQPGPSV